MGDSEKQRHLAAIETPAETAEPLAADAFLRVRIIAEGEGQQLREWQDFINTTVEPMSVYQAARNAIDAFAADVREHADAGINPPAGLVLIVEPLLAP